MFFVTSGMEHTVFHETFEEMAEFLKAEMYIRRNQNSSRDITNDTNNRMEKRKRKKRKHEL